MPKADLRRRVCRYVMQDDRMMATETVAEVLGFAANMALPSCVAQPMQWYSQATGG